MCIKLLWKPVRKTCLYLLPVILLPIQVYITVETDGGAWWKWVGILLMLSAPNKHLILNNCVKIKNSDVSRINFFFFSFFLIKAETNFVLYM